MSNIPEQILHIPRGIARFKEDGKAAWLDIGNAKNLEITPENEEIEHANYRNKDSFIDQTVNKSHKVNGAFTVDSISSEVLRLFCHANDLTESTQAITAVTDEPHTAKLGKWLKVGATATDSLGKVDLSAVRVTDDTDTDLDQATNYILDAKGGWVYIMENAADISEDDTIHFDYTPAATVIETIKGGTQKTIQGQFMFTGDPIKTNGVNTKRQIFIADVTLSSANALPLIAEEFQELGMTMKLRDTDNFDGLYDLHVMKIGT